MIDPLFEVHMLNEEGRRKAGTIATSFDLLLKEIDKLVTAYGSREKAIVKTKLEEACFFAKKGMAKDPENQA